MIALNSPFAKLFLALQERIASAVPEIRHIDQDLGQLEFSTLRPKLAFPCVLIDFSDFDFDDDGNNGQKGEGDIGFRLAFAPYSNTSQSTPDTYKYKALAYYELEWKLHKALHGWSPDEYDYGEEFGRLNRKKAGTEGLEDDLRVRTMRYGMSFEDQSTQNAEEITIAAELLVCYQDDGNP